LFSLRRPNTNRVALVGGQKNQYNWLWDEGYKSAGVQFVYTCTQPCLGGLALAGYK
jgi:hypothetical protein